MKLVTAVRRALDDVEAQPRDGAAIELALTYARRIDGGEPLERLGPALLAALDALGMTPKARAALVKGATGERRPSPLDQLRERRAARQGRAETLDAAAT